MQVSHSLMNPVKAQETGIYQHESPRSGLDHD